MTSKNVVIIGAGQGGLQVAISLRMEGFEGQITLIGEEPNTPYQRPPLSKSFLKTGDVNKIQLRPAAFFEKNNITLLLGCRVENIDRVAQTISVGEKNLPYDTLILATGTRNLQPPIPGVEHTYGLRTVADAQVLRNLLDSPKQIAIIGGGFIGLEFAAVARQLGHSVTVSEAAPRLMARAISIELSEQFRLLHERIGTQMHLNCAASEVRETGMTLHDGTYLPADLVLLAAGVVPNTELALSAGLVVQNGIVVDARLRTNDYNIFALGDCAAFPNPTNGKSIRLESVQAATDHARLIAKQIVSGEEATYTAVPWFWSEQADWKLQIAGLASLDDESVPVDKTTVLRFCNSQLCAVETINETKIHMKARRLLAQKTPPSRDKLAEISYDILQV